MLTRQIHSDAKKRRFFAALLFAACDMEYHDYKVMNILRPGETVVWSSRPSASANLLDRWLHIPTLVFLFFSLLLGDFIFYFSFGLILLFSISECVTAKNIMYVITNKRALIFHLKKCQVITSYFPEDIRKIKCNAIYGDRGNVIFLDEGCGFIGIRETCKAAAYIKELRGKGS